MRRAPALALVCVLFVSGCASPAQNATGESGSAAPANSATSASADANPSEMTVIVDDATGNDKSVTIGDEASGSSTEATSGNEAQDATYTHWSEAEAPEYYLVAGTSHIDKKLEPGTAMYSALDEYGRTRQAVACVTYEMMKAGQARERQNISELHPAGWGHNSEVDIELANGSTYHGMFWNRSHLIAKSLGGIDELENLVTGTRMQNVGSNLQDGSPGGMGYPEGLAHDWLDAHPTGSITYVATPVYEGDEPVCRYVIVDLLSSDGSLDQRVVVFNAAKGYEIDYATGEFRKEA